MDFRPKCTRRSVIKPSFSDLNEIYPHFLQMYKVPPTYEISFKEFEECTAERLSVLQIIEDVTSRGLKGDAWRKAIKDELKKQPELRIFTKLICATPLETEEADFFARRRDHISHFVLRLAYCDTEDKRRWFIARELDLFKLRWISLEHTQQNAFLLLNNLKYDQLLGKEKLELLSESLDMIKAELLYYKVPFTLVPELVKQRKVFLKKGIAYINSDDIISVILTSYRAQLSHSLAYASRRLHTLDEDERIFSLLKGAGKSEREVQYVIKDKEAINIADLDKFSESSYPLCMQHIHHTMKREHHLKHFCRLQYSLFLKGMGVTLDDCIKFFRSEFCKKMDLESFSKKYIYGIRHNFGHEGKRANYSPHSCLKIINGSVNPGDHHGCPFRHRDAVAVKKMLADNGLSTIGAQEVVGLMREGHYQLACSKYFNLKHNTDHFIVNHPNHFFDESQRILSGKAPATYRGESSYAPSQTPSKVMPKTSQKEAKNEDLWDLDDSTFDLANIEVMDTS